MGYRARKYARKHKGLLTTAVLVVVALLAGTGVSTWQAVRASEAEQVAEDRLDDVEAERDRAEQNMRAALAALEQLLNHVANPDLFEIPELQATPGSRSSRPTNWLMRNWTPKPIPLPGIAS